jgi:hypothetical protein
VSVIAVCGLPGAGKTLFTTALMRKHYNSDNGIFKRIFARKKCDVNIYSNYPIKFQKNKLSNKFTFDDLCSYKKYPMDCDLVLDEFQSYFDSLDFKSFPRLARNNLQFHRHYGIHNIYLVSQHPSRIVKQARVLVCEFYEIKKFIKIPLIGVGIFKYNVFYNYEDYGKPTKNVKKSEVPYEFKRRMMFCRYKRTFKSYNTKYMRCLVDDEPLISQESFIDTSLNLDEIHDLFNI